MTQAQIAQLTKQLEDKQEAPQAPSAPPTVIDGGDVTDDDTDDDVGGDGGASNAGGDRDRATTRGHNNRFARPWNTSSYLNDLQDYFLDQRRHDQQTNATGERRAQPPPRDNPIRDRNRAADPPITNNTWMSAIDADNNSKLLLQLMASGMGENTPFCAFLQKGVTVPTFEKHYPHLAKQGYFGDFKNYINTIRTIRRHEDAAAVETKQLYTLTKIDADILDANVGAAREPMDFLFHKETFKDSFHPRLLHRLGLVSAQEFYVAIAQLPAECRIPVKDYDLTHLPGVEFQISPRGWLFAHKPDLQGFNIHDFHAHDTRFSKSEHGGECEWDSTEPLITQINQFMLAIENHRIARFCAAPLDRSLEPIRLHFLNKQFYLKLRSERGNLTATQFCIKAYHALMDVNAFNFKHHRPCMVLDDVDSEVRKISQSLASQVAADPKPATPAAPSSRGHNQAAGTANKKAAAKSKNKDKIRFCSNYQTLVGCKNSEDGGISCMTGTLGPFMHQCNKWIGGKQCRKRHCRDKVHGKKQAAGAAAANDTAAPSAEAKSDSEAEA